ncbi:MAG: HAD-IIA family hydrolase [Campylobacter sp.]|nr:HAD-IIA family hydrolase [Campylobacter sp.]
MLFLDVQGTLLSDADKSLIDGAKTLISFLNSKNLAYLIITNNTKKLNFLEELRTKGLEIKQNAYLDPFCVFNRLLKPCKVAAYGSKEFLQSIENLGYELDFKTPNAVLIASYDDFKFDDFASIIEFAQNDVKIIAMHETSIYKKNHRLYPGVGSVMAMIQNASGCDYEVVGKPSFAFYKQALTLIKEQNPRLEFKDITIVSDDFKGDLLKAKELGMKCVLVLSGKISSTKGLDTSILDGVFESILEFEKEFECKV